MNDYDQIPGECLGQKILEIGPGDGSVQLQSRLANYFHSLATGSWMGIDHRAFPDVPYFKITADITTLDIRAFAANSFDMIIMSHVLEHVDIRKWNELFDKILHWLQSKGYLVIITPYREEFKKTLSVYNPEILDHCMFGIDREIMNYFLKSRKVTVEYRTFNRWYISEKGDSILRIVTRYAKRFIKGSYFFAAGLPRRRMLMSIVRKQ